MRAAFIDASDALADVLERQRRPDDIEIAIHRAPDIAADDIPGIVGDAEIVIIDHTNFPTAIAARCPRLGDVVFLGTGARSYMNIEELAARGVAVHLIKGYGDTAVAECAIGLMFACAKNIAAMDRGVRAGGWPRTEAMELRGKTLGLVGFGGIGRETARIALGLGMKVIAWNRSPAAMDGVAFVEIDRLLAESHVVSLHLLLNDETRGILDRARLFALRPGAILVNTARGALLDEAALVDALSIGPIAAAGLDVFAVEPLPAGHALAGLSNVTLSAHSAFRTPEASENLIAAALVHCRRIAAGKQGGNTPR